MIRVFRSQVPGTEGGSPTGQNLDLIQEAHLSDANKVSLTGQVRDSRVRVIRVYSVSGARHRRRQTTWEKQGLNPRPSWWMPKKLGRPCDRPCLASMGKLWFLGLRFLMLTQFQVSGTEGGSPAGRNLA